MFSKKSLAMAMLGSLCGGAIADEPIKLFAAGSLTGALTAVAKQYQADTGETVETVFGPSGLLRERMEKGEAVDVFASADMDSPLRLFSLGKASAPVVFARNRLCATARPDIKLTTANFLSKLLDPAIGLGTSTPKADPGGDYAWKLFAKADRVRPGARAILEAKAQQLVGGPASPPVPGGQDAVKYYFASGKVHVFLGYCSSRQPVAERVPDPGVDRVELPADLAILPDYGLTVLNRTAQPRQAAYRFALYVMSAKAQRIMAAYGFIPVALPAQEE
ncbi:MAG: substrate-binding domain-containing protein [Pseudomonadota bacterium]